MKIGAALVMTAFTALGGAVLGCSTDAAGVQQGTPAAQGGDVSSGGSGAVAGSVSAGGSGGAISSGGVSAVGGNTATDAGSTASGGSAVGGGAGVGAGGTGPVESTLTGCALAFPYQDEPTLGTWLGGDSAYSTLLSPSVALWSFQDTFIGKHGQTTREGAGLIANSYALVTCAQGKGSIHYFWRETGDRAILSDGAANQRFWPQQPILYKGFLFQAMTRVQGGASEIGSTLARVSNPLDPPNTWHAEYFELTNVPGLGKGTIVVGNYAYLFTTSAGQAIVTRLPLDQLIKPDAVPSALMQYLANDGQWKAGLDAAAAKKLGFAANVGTSFRYLASISRWLVLFTNTTGWPSADVAVSTAPALEGPWSKPINVYQVPEMTSGSPEYEKDNVCYAAIEHAESNPNPDSDLLFSYTCNSLVLAKQVANMALYSPKIVKLKNPVAN